MSFFDGEMKIRVSAASGTEAVLKRELTALGYTPGGAERGRVGFLKAVMPRRGARQRLSAYGGKGAHSHRGGFPPALSTSFTRGMRAVRWRDILPGDAAVAVSAKSFSGKLFSLRDIQKIAKKAIADDYAARFGGADARERGKDMTSR